MMETSGDAEVICYRIAENFAALISGPRSGHCISVLEDSSTNQAGTTV